MNIDELKRQLELATERAARREGSIDQQLAAMEAVSDAERALAAAQGLEYAAPFDIGCRPESAVSGPVLLQTDYDTFLTFNAMRKNSAGKWDDAGTAVVEIERCTITQFGYPNDEALPGHPLYKRGISYYGVYEVFNSTWIRQLRERNRVSFPSCDYPDGKHFIICFHDSSFECICRALKVTTTFQPYPEIFTSLSKRALRMDA